MKNTLDVDLKKTAGQRHRLCLHLKHNRPVRLGRSPPPASPLRRFAASPSCRLGVASLLHALPLPKSPASRFAVFSQTPRFESRVFSASGATLSAAPSAASPQVSWDTRAEPHPSPAPALNARTFAFRFASATGCSVSTWGALTHSPALQTSPCVGRAIINYRKSGLAPSQRGKGKIAIGIHVHPGRGCGS